MRKLEEVWSFNADSEISSSILVGKLDKNRKLIIFGTKKGTIYVLDGNAEVKLKFSGKETKNEVESLFYEEEDTAVFSNPILVEDNILFCFNTGRLVCFNSNYKKIWDVNINSKIKSTPLYHNKTIFLTTLDGQLKAYKNGKEKWTVDVGSPIESSPTIFNNNIVFGSNDGIIHSYTLTGKEKWKVQTGGKIIAKGTSSKIKGNERLLIGSTDKKLYCISINGQEKWNYETEGPIVSEVIIEDINNDGKKEIIFGSLDNSLYVLNSKGQKEWSFQTDFWIVSKPIIEDINNDGKKEIIIGSYDQKIYILDSEGSFILDYVPGISTATTQPGSYSELITSEPGEFVGKKLMEFDTKGMIVGIGLFHDKESTIVVATKKGEIQTLKIKKRGWESWLKT
jgi:outer membrane protein assembly factor BamB